MKIPGLQYCKRVKIPGLQYCKRVKIPGLQYCKRVKIPGLQYCKRVKYGKSCHSPRLVTDLVEYNIELKCVSDINAARSYATDKSHWRSTIAKYKNKMHAMQCLLVSFFIIIYMETEVDFVWTCETEVGCSKHSIFAICFHVLHCLFWNSASLMLTCTWHASISAL